MKKIIALLLTVITLSSCEKDDICTDETTPRLILEFFDVSNPTVPKNVINLKVKGVNSSIDLGLFTGVSKVELPLDITQDTTKYSLILNSTGSLGTPNEDFLEFNYIRQNVFVSRACGFKTVFTLNPSPTGVIVTDAAAPDLFWIQPENINIETTNIVTENETHVKIYF
ncbi:MAG: DUF6452 family protein [Flavobacterium sp. JAD_PAG50586_2]|nr:MAG: DUF6452 family protein [Flavobacterium sp. JAD_PAG50586_2]